MGRPTDLGRMGAIFGETREKMLAPRWRHLGHRNHLRIDAYDDLVLPGHRLLAQNAIAASNESPNDASAVEQAAPGRSRRRPGGAKAVPEWSSKGKIRYYFF